MATLVTDIPQLKFNKMSKEKYEELLANGELVENEFYITPENEEDISDKADITYVDEQIALKADKETTYTKEEVDSLVANVEVDAYTKEEVDNLIANIDIPEQTPNIKGGEYIDVIEPKGETLYEFGEHEMYVTNGLTSGWKPIFTKTTDIETISYTPEGNTLTESYVIFNSKLPEEYVQYLIPAYKEDGSVFTAIDCMDDVIFKNNGYDVSEYTNEEKVALFKELVHPNIDINTPVYVLKNQLNESFITLQLFFDNSTGEYGMWGTMGNAEPINTIEIEPSDKSLTIDFNEKALEMIENAGSDITTNGWNIFDHKFSDHLLNDPSWVRSDTFSWQDGGIYFTAYEELEKENSGRIEDVITTETWYAYVQNDGSTTLYTNEEVPITEENTNISVPMYTVSGDEISGYSFTKSSIYTMKFKYSDPDTSVRIDVEAEPGLFMQEYFNYTPELNIVIEGETIEGNLSSDTIGDITITYYKSANGLKICLPDQSDAIEQLYANTGVAWYYIIDTENKRFKLPRKISETLDLNTVAVVGNGMALGLTDGTNNYGMYLNSGDQGNSSIARNVAYGVELGTSVTVSGNGTNGVYGITTDPEKSGIIADLSSIGYKEVTEQTYLYFFMGDTLRDARIIDVNAVVENQASVTNELDALKNLLATIDYVVESKVATDEDPTWYRVYKSGWVEQGGISVEVSAAYLTINLLKNYSSTNYSLVTTAKHDGTDVAYDSHVGGVTTSSFNIYSKEAVAHPVYWEAKGQGAE